jgi:hypothetical protein
MTMGVPDAIAGYRITRPVGTGDLGTVYLSQDPQLPRVDALKVLAPQLTENKLLVAEFERSVELASNLSHPNVVPIYASGQFAQQRWVAMQFVEGGNVDEAVRHGTMNPARATHVVAEVAKALDYAHHRGVVHGAVHPGNVLLSEADSGPERVLLGDFGSARVLDAAVRPRPARLAAPYSAPEVLDGLPYTTAADVYSLGCLLFRLWTGRIPDLSQPVEWTTGLPAPIAAVVAQATAKDPRHRFGSPGELAAAASAAHAEYECAQSVSEAASLRRRSRSKRWGAAAATAVLIVAAVFALSRVSGRDVGGHPIKSTAVPTPVAVKALPGLLLDAGDLGKLVGVPMTIAQNESKLGLEEHDNAACAGAFMPTEVREYTTTGYLGVKFQRWVEQVAPGQVGGVLPWLAQAVAAFPSAAVADLFRARETQRWTACDKQQIVFSDVQIVLSDVRTSDKGVLTIKQTLEGGLGVACTRAVAVRNNVAIDANVCSTDDDRGRVLNLVDAISHRIPA